jgi:hypothetical protein
MSVAGYILVVSDSTYLGPSILPDESSVPRTLYRSIAAAKRAATEWMNTFSKVRFALYGEAFPYEGTTLEQECATKGVGTIGWVQEMDEEGVPDAMTVYVVALTTEGA